MMNSAHPRLPQAPKRERVLFATLRKPQEAFARQLGRPIVLRSVIGLDMVLIPPGRFTAFGGYEMRVSKPYRMSATPITQAQWLDIMGTDPSCFLGASHPVERVTWHDAVAFCEKLSAREGRRYQLPTEAQWEHAARAEASTPFCHGQDASRMLDYAWCDDNSDNGTKPVATRLPNPWGLHDMQGNVWEWCADWFGDRPESGRDTDPTGPATGQQRVLRGGAWSSFASTLSHLHRAHNLPDNPVDDNGLRVICELE